MPIENFDPSPVLKTLTEVLLALLKGAGRRVRKLWHRVLATENHQVEIESARIKNARDREIVKALRLMNVEKRLNIRMQMRQMQLDSQVKTSSRQRSLRGT